jgi:hypothetical protein
MEHDHSWQEFYYCPLEVVVDLAMSVNRATPCEEDVEEHDRV